MNILYVSNYNDEKYFKYIFDNAKNKPIQNIQKFNKLFVSGLEKNDDVSNITILTNASVNRKISNKIFWKGKNVCNGKVSFWYIPFLNIRIIKQVCLFVISLLFLLYWCIKNFNKRCALISDGYFPIVSTISSMMCKFFGIPVVTLYTDLPKCSASSLIDGKSTFRKTIDFIMNIGDKINIKCSNMFILLTEEMNKIVNKKNKPYIVIEGMVDRDFQLNLKTKKSKAIMYAGGLYEQYGVKLLIDSFIKWNNKDYELWLCGDGELVEYIKNLNNDKIKYFGSISNEIVVKMEREAMLLVNPRFTDKEYTKYSFPSKNMEYMVSGTAVLTTKLPGMPKEYNKFVYSIDEETETGFINEFNKLLLKNTNKLIEKGKKVQCFVLEEKNNVVQVKKIINFLKPNIDRDRENRKKFFLLTLFLSIILIICGYFLKNIEICKVSLILCFMSVLIKSLYNYKKYLILIFFLISFFTFGMGQYFFDNVTNDILYYKNYQEIYVIKTILIQFLSLLSLYCGYEAISHFNLKRKAISLCDCKNKVMNLFKKIIVFFLVLTFISSILVNIEKMIFVLNNDYRSLYTDAFHSIFPTAISKLASYYLIFFLFYLSLENSKRNICISLTLFMLNNIINLLSGSRFLFVYGIILILFYLLISCFNNNVGLSKKIKKISIYVCLLFIPLLLVFLNMYNGIRNDNFSKTVNPIFEIESFFVSQGRSANLITYAQIYENELKSGHANFVFGNYYDTLVEKSNKIFNTSTNTNKPENNFGTVISKKVLGEESVKKGNGLGTNYLAELYISYGFVGIILFNILFGMLLGYFYLNNNNGFIYKFYCLSFMSPVMHILRGSSFEAISIFFSFTVFSILLLYALLYIIFRKGGSKNEIVMGC